MTAELIALHLGAALYFVAAALAVIAQARGTGQGVPVATLAGALAVHAVAIALRWLRLDHGPYVDMFEVLSSNVWSLHAAILLAVLVLPRLAPLLAAVLPPLQILLAWMLSLEPQDTSFPVTYDTLWLPFHVWLGKAFLGITTVAVAISIVVLLRLLRRQIFAALPGSAALDEISFRLILLAFVFESLMLVAGAAWAQDAWGRYWGWDPLETWSFVTWLAVGGYLHLRVTRRPSPAWSAAMVLGIFAVAFATFLGIPFVTLAPHQGMV